MDVAATKDDVIGQQRGGLLGGGALLDVQREGALPGQQGADLHGGALRERERRRSEHGPGGTVALTSCLLLSYALMKSTSPFVAGTTVHPPNA